MKEVRQCRPFKFLVFSFFWCNRPLIWSRLLKSVILRTHGCHMTLHLFLLLLLFSRHCQLQQLGQRMEVLSFQDGWGKNEKTGCNKNVRSFNKLQKNTLDSKVFWKISWGGAVKMDQVFGKKNGLTLHVKPIKWTCKIRWSSQPTNNTIPHAKTHICHGVNATTWIFPQSIPQEKPKTNFYNKHSSTKPPGLLDMEKSVFVCFLSSKFNSAPSSPTLRP